MTRGAWGVGVEELDIRGEESPFLLERMIVAPVGGRYEPAPANDETSEGELVRAGEAVGTITSLGEASVIASAFAGRLMGVLVRSGERVEAGQPIAWLRVLEDVLAE